MVAGLGSRASASCMLSDICCLLICCLPACLFATAACCCMLSCFFAPLVLHSLMVLVGQQGAHTCSERHSQYSCELLAQAPGVCIAPAHRTCLVHRCPGLTMQERVTYTKAARSRLCFFAFCFCFAVCSIFYKTAQNQLLITAILA